MKIERLTDDQAVKDVAYPIEVKVYENGVQVVPTSATITLKDPDGTAQVTAGTVSVAVAGTMTYSLSATYTATLWENAIMEITYVVSTVSYKAVFLFDVVLNALKCDVMDDDLKAYAPLIADDIWSGSTTYYKQIDEAFRVVKRAIKDKGKRPHMLIDGGQVRELVILKSFCMICFDFSKSPEDIWWARYLKFKEEYDSAFASLIIKYDADESGTIETEDGEDTTLGQINFQR